jgi:Uma2 family endonuclease
MTIEADQLEKLLTSPRLPFYAQQIQEVLKSEEQRRRDFYNQISEGDKAEFINGEIIIHSPVKFCHNNASLNLLVLLRTYVLRHELGLVGHEKIMISLSRNDYEPDVCYFNKTKTSQFTPDQMRFPAPDFVVEVLSESTAANDRGVKFEDYAAHGILEYWIVDPEAETIEQYQLRDDAYELAVKVKSGQIDSLSIPGFSIPVQAVFDEQENSAALQKLLAA